MHNTHYPRHHVSLGLKRLTHPTKSNTLDNQELIDTIFASLTAETTLLNTAKSITISQGPL